MSKARDIADLDFNSPDIDGGNIDGATIGGTTPAAGSFSNVNVGGQNILNDNYDAVGAIFRRNGSHGAVISLGRQGVGDGVTLDYPSDNTFAVSTAGIERFQISSGGAATFSSSVTIDSTLLLSPDGSNDLIKSTGGVLYLKANELSVQNNSGVEFFGTSSAGTVFNNGSVDMDFRVESNDNQNMLFVDGGNNQVVIGNSGASNSAQHLAVHGNTGLGNRLTSSSGGGYVTEISGTSLTTDGSNWYGSYGVLNFYATASYTGSARRWTLTNGYRTNRFAFLVGDTDTSSQPELDGNGGQASNAFSPLWFDSGTGGATFNDDGKDADFRVESSGNANMLFVDGGNDKVGIGTNSLGRVFNVYHPTTDGAIKLETGGNASNVWAGIEFKTPTSQSFIYIPSNDSTGLMKFLPASSEVLALSNSAVVVNEQSSDVDFRVESNNNPNMLFIDASADTVNIGNTTDFGGVLNVNGGLNSKQAVFTSTNNRGLALSTATRSGQNDGVAIIDAQDTESTGGRLELHTMGAERARFERDQIVFNETGNNQDFRVESDTQDKAIYVDADNDSVQILGNKFLEPVHAYYISSGTLNRNITVDLNNCGEYYLIMHIVGIWPYSGSNPGTRIIEVTGFSTSNVATVVRNTHYGSGPTGAVTVSATGNDLVVNIVTGQNYRWSAHCEVVHGGGGMSMSVDGNDG